MYKKSVLDNGLTIITESMTDVRSVSIGVWIKVGSRYENEMSKGISHFLEHMMFKGTQTRTAKDIAETIDSVGGTLNAATSREYTYYYVKVLDEHFKLGLELLADIVLNSTFSEEELEKEKTVILEEIRMGEDAPDEHLYDIFMENIWPANPLGWPVIGRREIIQDASREDLSSFYQANYHAPNTIIAIAGNIEHDQAVQLVKSYFGIMKKQECLIALPVSEPTFSKTIINKELEQVHFYLGVKGLPFTHKDRYASYVFSSILGGSMSSRLFQKVREERGLVYSIYSCVNSFKDTGIFYTYAGCSKDTLLEVLQLIFEEFLSIKEKGVTSSELQRTKENFKGNSTLRLESTNNRMERLAVQEMYFNRYFSLDEVIADIQKVDLDDIYKIANDFLDRSHLTFAALGPIGDEDVPEGVLDF
ncbi:MAG: pitrilysin family protein [bacterium]